MTIDPSGLHKTIHEDNRITVPIKFPRDLGVTCLADVSRGIIISCPVP
jgi:hypothetical protein